MEFLARVNPKYFAAIQIFASTKDIRYYLNGVRIEPHPEQGALIVATDGHRLAVMHDPDGMCKEPIIVGEITKSLVSACRAKGKLTKLNVPANLWICRGGAIVTADESKAEPSDLFADAVLHMSKIKLIEAKYPDWRRVIPKKRDLKADHFPILNGDYVADVSEAARLLLGDSKRYSTPHLSLESTGRDCSVIVRIVRQDLEDRFVAVIMPVRAEPVKTILPTWLMPTEEQTEASAQ